MSILVYGAGVMGSLYAARLTGAGRDVAVLARGQRAAEIRTHGLVLRDVPTGHLSVTHTRVVDELAPGDAYHLVIVLVPKHHLSAVLPPLAANRQTPTILFMGNNAEGPQALTDGVGRERLVLGFPGAGGSREGHEVRYQIASRHHQPTTVGEIDGRITPRLREIATTFQTAGFPVAISPNMDAWLKTHVAEVSPAANALYMAGLDTRRLARTRDGLVLMIRAIREGYQVLRRLGVPITPPGHRIFAWVPEPILVAVMRRLLRGETAKTLLEGHATAARAEMVQLAHEFERLAGVASVPTPAMDRLRASLDPAASPLPDGSASIPLGW